MNGISTSFLLLINSPSIPPHDWQPVCTSPWLTVQPYLPPCEHIQLFLLVIDSQPYLPMIDSPSTPPHDWQPIHTSPWLTAYPYFPMNDSLSIPPGLSPSIPPHDWQPIHTSPWLTAYPYLLMTDSPSVPPQGWQPSIPPAPSPSGWQKAAAGFTGCTTHLAVRRSPCPSQCTTHLAVRRSPSPRSIPGLITANCSTQFKLRTRNRTTPNTSRPVPAL